MTNGEDLRVSAWMKPISTLMKPLRSVDLTTMEESPAAIERSDVCAVPAAAVVGEAMVALVLADALVERFGGDAIADVERALAGVSRRRPRALPPSMIRPILRYGERPLHQPAADVTVFDDNLQRLIDDMIETMYAAPGIGLAATQVGVPLRVFVVDVSVGRDRKDLIVMINPAFAVREGMQLEEEGCLSVPGFNATVVRPSRTVLTGLDRHGVEQTVEAKGLLARAFQHEMDHLDGVVFVDRLRGIKRDLIVRKIQKLKRNGRW